MASINNLTSKIIKDAEDKKEVILSEAEKESKKIIDKKIEEAKAAEKIIIEKAEIEAVSKKERIISNAHLQARNEKLKAKQEVISEIFQSTVEALCSISEDDFKNFVKTAILNSNITGKQKIILNNEGKKIISEAVLLEINKELKSKASVNLSEETGNFKGGFILEKEGIEINNTFEALVNSLKDDLSQEVARELF
ncbi:V-type proton ATPase subunit E [Clostridium puniceum]|uniref:V-type proton ATPase subunit E n=1 Tax=Clostridium puniceum TaxID=29367 RepID=A0A1S8T833_9CLOT|nr:V-type ATP synthase subunit E family protein [Clostridium puniceum]OOM73906.1 V-type proton ATPase subunit E [Clostridium puniceum]